MTDEKPTIDTTPEQASSAELPQRNPKFPEHINVGRQQPLTDLVQLTLGALISLAIAFVIIWQSLSFIAGWVPLSWEGKLAALLEPEEPERTEREIALQARLNRILVAMNYDDDFPITVHVLEQPEVNAFATLGGHIFVFQGLLDALQTDIGLDMVLAHEAAHILNRDPIQSAASTLGFQVFLALVGVSTDFGNSGDLIDSGSQLLFLDNSRQQERQADARALDALAVLYDDITGADELFTYILEQEDAGKVPEFLSSHPHPEHRIDLIRERINGE